MLCVYSTRFHMMSPDPETYHWDQAQIKLLHWKAKERLAASAPHITLFQHQFIHLKLNNTEEKSSRIHLAPAMRVCNSSLCVSQALTQLALNLVLTCSPCSVRAVTEVSSVSQSGHSAQLGSMSLTVHTPSQCLTAVPRDKLPPSFLIMPPEPLFAWAASSLATEITSVCYCPNAVAHTSVLLWASPSIPRDSMVALCSHT